MAKREVEHDQLPMPNGWFAVSFSRDLRIGDVKPIEYFGEELVVFRSRAGKAHVLDPFCPHLGAHMGHGGRVAGENLRCPFHGWQYDGDSGQCMEIPYCERIPPKARVRAWEVQEKNGFVWVWYHSEQKPPEWDFPTMPEFEDEGWSEPRQFDLVMDAHVQDTHENNNDPVHFQFVHRQPETPPGEITYDPDSTHYRIQHTSTRESAIGTFEVTLLRDSWGLGLTAVRSEGIPGAGLLMYSSTTPIDEKRVHSRWLLTCTNNMVDVAGEEFMSNLTRGVYDDFPIWQNKVHRARPVLCDGDEHLAGYRRWARQFYTNPIGEVEE